MKLLRCALLLALFSFAAPASGQVTTETVVDGLYNPCGVAIQPETGHVFVADSGALRVVRVVDGKIEDVITDFPKDIYGKGPMFDIGPLGLVFLDKDTLVVGGGGLPDGEELLRVYTVPAAGEAAIKADAMKSSFSLAATDEIKGEGNFYALAKTDKAIYVTCNGDDTKGWVSKLEIKEDGSFGEYTRFLATKEATELDAPVGITMSPRGEIAIGQMGEITVPNDSLLTFYDTAGKMLLNLPTQLNDITAVAYSSQTPQMFALDFAWADTSQGGLFKLVADRDDDDKLICVSKKMVELDKPTAMVFAEDGSLYITVCGTAAEGEEKKPGKLLKIAPGL